MAEKFDSLSELINKIEAFNINKALLEIAVILLEEYQNIKQQNNHIDYEDILLKSLMILAEDNHNLEYQLNLIKHILVDEAQDTSLIQWDIIDHIYKDYFSGGIAKTILVVGDEKQSIYGFQGAQHNLFKEKYLQLNAKLELLEANFQRLDLNKSYRTSYGIIDLVNLYCQNPVINNCLANLNHDLHHKAHRQTNYLLKVLPFSEQKKTVKAKPELKFYHEPRD